MNWRVRVHRNTRKIAVDVNVAIEFDCNKITPYGKIYITLRQHNNYPVEFYVKSTGGIAFKYKETAKNSKELSRIWHYIRRVEVDRSVKHLRKLEKKRDTLGALYHRLDYMLTRFRRYRKRNLMEMLIFITEKYEPNMAFFYKCQAFILNDTDITTKHDRYKFVCATEWRYDEPAHFNHRASLDLQSIPLHKVDWSRKSLKGKISYEDFLEAIEDISENDIIDMISLLGGNINSKVIEKTPKKYLYNLIHRRRKI